MAHERELDNLMAVNREVEALSQRRIEDLEQQLINAFNPPLSQDRDDYIQTDYIDTDLLWEPVIDRGDDGIPNNRKLVSGYDRMSEKEEFEALLRKRAEDKKWQEEQDALMRYLSRPKRDVEMDPFKIISNLNGNIISLFQNAVILSFYFS